MTWTNAFDAGECTVEVFRVATPDTPDYSAILAKSQGADLTILSWSLHISVSADGIVTLSNVSGLGIEADIGARVVPIYLLTSMLGARAVLPTSVSGVGNTSADGVNLVAFTNGDSLIDLSAQTPYTRISAQTDTIGASSGTPVVQFTPEFDVPPPPPPVPKCAELGRVTRAYVSGYQRDRVHASRLVRGEKRCLVANFNGAFDTARTIVAVTWRCEQNYTVVMANARIPADAREVAVDITAQMQGCAWVKCEATLDNGEAYTQLFRVFVCAAPWFDGEQSPSAGPAVLTSP